VLPRKTNTTVGIAIPAYKRGHHLAATLESALRQTRPADEIVIVDDCSPDNTRDVALAYASRGVRYVRNAVNFGVPENYNVSIDQLTSDYVFILEDHDLLAPTFVERCATALDQHPDANLAFTDIAEIDEHGSVIRENRFNRPAVIPSAAFAKDLVTMVGAIFGLTAMIRRTALEGLEPYFDPKYWAYADIYLWIRLALGGSAAYVPEPLLQMRVREEGHHLDGREWDSLRCVDRIKRDCWPLVFPAPTIGSVYHKGVYRLKQDRVGLQQIVADIARGQQLRWTDMGDDKRQYLTPLGRLLARAVTRVTPRQAQFARRLYHTLLVAPMIGTRRLRRPSLVAPSRSS